jgi:hypothetical protein
MRDLCCELAARKPQRFVDDNDLFHEGKLNALRALRHSAPSQFSRRQVHATVISLTF